MRADFLTHPQPCPLQVVAGHSDAVLGLSWNKLMRSVCEHCEGEGEVKGVG